MKRLDIQSFFWILNSSFGNHLNPTSISEHCFNHIVNDGFEDLHPSTGSLTFLDFGLKLDIQILNYDYYLNHRYHSKNYVHFLMHGKNVRVEAVLMNDKNQIFEEIFKLLVSNMKDIVFIQRSLIKGMEALGYSKIDFKDGMAFKKNFSKGYATLKYETPIFSRMKFFQERRDLRNKIIFFPFNMIGEWKGVERFSRMGYDLAEYTKRVEISMVQNKFIDFEELTPSMRDNYIKGLESNLLKCPKNVLVFHGSLNGDKKLENSWDVQR